ncbi:MAG TPA: S8 family serine peptidase [Candidatus Aphodousia faecigallinarum]|uniref:S8 family serine peptidase n=1 Tax=Candidatus Aphodousia faecigallinarum TaxID=2840677 RepID=A0A9D1IHA4_9BURK|nr:S8 family serine peptidase [Candidatus Aphodousia faecigallinarum]
MNKTFKTLWNDARRAYIVTNEVQKSHGKPTKSALTAAVMAVALFSGVASAAYVEPGIQGNISSWETPEYNKDHGMALINASTAYAEGLNGKGVLIGIVDSGALLSHPELKTNRIFPVTATGSYVKDGTRYPFAYMGQTGEAKNRFGVYHKGEKFKVGGDFILGHNDSHGTHVTGVAAGNRNGEEAHGVAWAAKVAVGNTGGSDNMNYGPYQDYGYFKAVWEATAKTGAKLINNSWGTNVRIGDTSHHFDVGQIGTEGEEVADNVQRKDFYTTNSVTEYYLFKKDAKDNGGKNFMDAAFEVAQKYNLIQIFTNGNRRFQNPFYRAAYPFYNPEAEQYWIAAGSVQRNPDDGSYTIYGDVNKADDNSWGAGGHNHAGFAKWWTVTSPTDAWNAAVDNKTGKPFNKVAGGTSNAAPHIAGSMAILMQRYAYMTPTQVRDVLFTTANRTNNGIGEALYGSDGDKLDPKVPDEDYGWGVIDLGKAIYGPGQFFGTFDVAVKGDDVWHNSISDEAIQARGEEDRAQMQKYSKRIAELKALEKLSDQQGWELEYKSKRLASIKDREAQGWTGKLVKHGKGDLTLTAVNSYTGGTQVAEGKLAGMTESFGTAPVTVDSGATLELHKSFTIVKAGQTGEVAVNSVGTDKTSDDAQVVLKAGSVLSLATDGISLKSLSVQGPATLDVRAVNRPEVTFTVDDAIEGADQLTVVYDKDRYSGAKVTVDGDTVKVNLTSK